MMTYITNKWRDVPELWADMLSEMCIARLKKKGIRYFYICSKVYQKSLMFKKVKTVELKEDAFCTTTNYAEDIDFKEKLDGLSIEENLAVGMLLRGVSIKKVRDILNLDWYQWKKFQLKVVSRFTIKEKINE